MQLNRFQTPSVSCCLAGVISRLNHCAPVESTHTGGPKPGLFADQGRDMPPHGNRLSQSTLADMVYEVPCLLDFLDPQSRASLSGCSKYLQRLVHSVTTTVTVNDFSNVESLVKGDWPCLVLVIVAGYVWWFQPPWPKHSNLQLLTAFNLCHCEESSSVTAFVVAAKPNQHKQKLMPTLSHMRVSEIRQLIGELAIKLPYSRGVRHTTSQSQLHRQHLARAVAYLRGLQWQQHYKLQMRYNGCRAETIAQLSTASWASLVVLDLMKSPLDAAGISALVKGSWASLTDLYLTGHQLDNAAVTQLIRGGPWSHLRSLQLQSCNLGADSIAIMMTAVMPRLEMLYLNSNKLDAAAATLLANADWPLRLQQLCLSDNDLNNTAMACLAQKPWPRLYNLYIDGNNIDVVGIQHLKQQSWPSLSTLNIGKNMLCAATWQALGLHQSDMSKVGLGKAGHEIQVLREGFHHDTVWPKLRYINFCPPRHPPCDDNSYVLAAFFVGLCLPQSQLHKLRVALTGMDIVGATALEFIGVIVSIVVISMFLILLFIFTVKLPLSRFKYML